MFSISNLTDEQVGFEILNMDSCFKIILNDAQKTRIKPKSFKLAGGDVLEVGDKFTAIDKKGSAGCPPIILTKPWYQQYEGRIVIPSYTSYGSWLRYQGQLNCEIALFSAHNPITNEKMYSPKKSNKDRRYFGVEDGYYMC